MHVYKYLNQTVRRIGESNGKSFRGLSKTKKSNTGRDSVSKVNSRLSFYYLLPVVEKCLDKSVQRKATPNTNTMQSFLRIGEVFFTLSQTNF